MEGVICQMYRIMDILSCLMFIGLFKSVSPVEMRTEGEMRVVNQKTNISLQCKFYSYHFNLFDNPVLWKKTQRGEQTQINMMSNIYNPFAKTGRFTVTYNPLTPIHTLDLTIINLSPEDSGNYTCEVREPEGRVMAQVTHYIFVRADVESLGITDTNSSTIPQPKRSITFTEGPGNMLRCVSTGGYPPPDMRVYIGDDDITKLLHWYQSPKLKGRKGLRLMTYYSERYSYNFEAKPRYDGRELTCAVEVAGYGRNHTLSILHVHYSPIIRCYDTPASVGEEIVQLACDIWAKPRIVSSYWVIDNNGTTVSVPSVVGEFWSQVQDQTSGAIRNSLFLRVVRKSSFRKYTLIAENDVGVTTHAVDLTEKFVIKPTPQPKAELSVKRTVNDYKNRNYYIYNRSGGSTIYTHQILLICQIILSSYIVINNFHGILCS